MNPILVYGEDPYLKSGKGRRLDHIVLAAGREGVDGHPTPKPIKVWSWLLERLTTKPAQTVFDPFLGSGTTMIAAAMEGRSCIGLEISPAYIDVIVERWQNFTGEKATLEGDGRTFEEIDAARFDGEARDRNSAGCYDEAIRAKREALTA